MSGQHPGLPHWKWQRISSVALIPLTVWLLYAISGLAGADHAQAAGFFSSPAQAFMAVLMTVVVAYHSQTGIQVICEDYLPPVLGQLLIWVTRIACIAGTLIVAWTMWAIGGAGS